MNIGRIATAAGPEWVVEEEGVLRRLPGGPFGADLAPGGVLGPAAGARLLAPCAPSKIVCVGRNYVEHAAEHGADVPERPLLFLKAPSALIGPGEAVVLPEDSQQVEHEAELALVIGRRGRHIAEESAWEHVLGVTCANDVTARDLQRADGQWTRGKGFDTFCPLGPWIVTDTTESEVADLEISCRVNGELRQHAEVRFLGAEISSIRGAVEAMDRVLRHQAGARQAARLDHELGLLADHRHVGAGDAAQAAADAAHLLHHLGVEVALGIDPPPHAEDLLRAGVNAELAALAAVRADDDLRHRRSFLS